MILANKTHSDQRSFTRLTLLQRSVCLLMLMFVLFPSAVNFWVSPKADVKPVTLTKNLEAYWAETDLNEYDLMRLLGDKQCHQSERQFLACVNAISSMADRLRLKLTTAGTFEPMSNQDMERRLSEKSDLTAWRTFYADKAGGAEFSFSRLWAQLKSKMTEPANANTNTNINKNIKMNSMFATGINAYLSIAQDPHTYIVPLAYYEEVLSQSESRSPHLGFVVRRIKGGALVRKVFTASPASRSGLRKGDRITELNGQAIALLHSSEFSELIRGQGGPRLRLKVERQVGSKKQTKHIEILRGETKFQSVESRVLDGQTRLGLLTIHKFARETCKLVRSAMIGMMEQSVRGLILDLRDNPGGQVDEAACVAGLFLPAGSMVFQTKYLDPLKSGETYWAEGPQLYDGPMAVVINSGSASAAEIVAGALKDLDRATLVGERSFGKGSFQDGSLWRQHSQIALFQTQGFYYFASGWTPQIVGLEPDLPSKVMEQGTAAMREEDLYLVPLRPLDLWTGPQSLAWLNRQACGNIVDSPAGSFEDSLIVNEILGDDEQLRTASDWVRCRMQGSSTTSGLPGL